MFLQVPLALGQSLAKWVAVVVQDQAEGAGLLVHQCLGLQAGFRLAAQQARQLLQLAVEQHEAMTFLSPSLRLRWGAPVTVCPLTLTVSYYGLILTLGSDSTVSSGSAGFSQQGATLIDKVKDFLNLQCPALQPKHFIFISCFTQAHERICVLLLPEFYQWIELLRFQ
jgi:hypothetical protein